MEKEIKDYIVKLLSQKYDLKEDEDIENFNYIESGYVDSMGLIKFIADIEEKFSIEFSEEEMTCDKFSTIGGLIQIIKTKI